VDAIPSLDRRGIRRSVLDRFSADRMTAAYEELYVDLLDRTRERSHAAV